MNMPEAAVTCSNCGTENPGGARFCNQCGSPLDQTSRGAERRQVTVVFSDLAGFTAMSERLDPEDVQTVMGEIFSEATRIIEKYSGRGRQTARGCGDVGIRGPDCS